MKILFARLFLSIIILLALTVAALNITPAHAATNPHNISYPAGLNPADWSQINAMLPPNFQEAYLKASNTDAGDNFGYRIAISGNTVVVGAAGEDSAATGINGNEADNSLDSTGAAYVFIRSGTGWSQQAYLKASNTDQNDLFGSSVAIDGDTLVVGAPNERSAATGVNGDEADDSLLGAGAAYVFVRSGVSWSQQAYLKASNTGQDDNFGISVSISGDTVVVGADGEDSSSTGLDGDGADNSAYSAGAAYIFNRSGISWSQQAYLKASNTNAADLFGVSVAIDGDTVVVGAIGEDSAATGLDGDGADNSASYAGAVYVFTRSGVSWSQQAYLKASNTDAGDRFGHSVDIDADTLVVGADEEASSATGVDGDDADNLAPYAGAAYIFTRSNTTWSQQAYLKASNADAEDFFGVSVSIDGDTVVVGSVNEASATTGINGDGADNSLPVAGAAYIFTRSGVIWSQDSYLKASNTGEDDKFGASLSISGGIVVVGAWSESSAATGLNGNQGDNSAYFSGAVYVFGPTPPNTPTPTITATATETAPPTITATVTSTPTSIKTATRTATQTKAATQTATQPTTKTKTPTPTKTPVSITLSSIAGQDGWVLETTETSGVGGTFNSAATTISLGDDAAKRQYRGVLSFSTGASIPDTATVTGVILKVKQQRILGGGDPVSFFQGFMADIKNGFFATSDSLQAADFQAAGNNSYGPFLIAPAGNIYSINLTGGKTLINKLATNNGLTQIRLRFNLDDNNNAIANILNLYSGDAVNAADRPQLVITYLP